MLAGDEPFAGAERELIPQILEEPPAPLSSFRQDLPDGSETVVLTAMSKNPEMRYQTVTEFANSLGADGDVAGVAQPNKKHELWKTAVVVVLGTILLASRLFTQVIQSRQIPLRSFNPMPMACRCSR